MAEAAAARYPASEMSFPRHLLLLAALAVWGPACAPAAPDGAVGGRAAPIVDGEPEPGMDAVVALVNRGTGGLCTATVISEHVILTAKHCVQGPGEEGPYPAGDFVVGIGPGVDSLERTLDVLEIGTTDGTWDLNGMGGTTGELIGVDIAVVTLAEPAGVEPVPMHRETVSGFAGVEVTVLGYGRTPEGDNANKYRTTTLVTVQSGAVLLGQAAVCTGDSGGPVLDEAGELIAVSSLGPAVCGDGPSAFNLFQRQLDLIDGAVRAAGDCVDERVELCDGDDDDCDGEVDEGCAELGASCESDDGCVGGGPCSDGVCSAPCDPLDPTAGCPDGAYCVRDGCEGRCRVGESGTAAWGAPCELDTDCATLHCVDPGDGVRRCLASCRGGEGGCLEGEACAAPAGACGACVDASLVAPRRLGERCAGDDECASGPCHVGPAGVGYCTRTCDADGECGGYRCVDGRCLRPEGHAMAGEGCDPARPCLAGLVCERTDEGRGLCAEPRTSPAQVGGGGCAVSGEALALRVQWCWVWPIPLVIVLLRRRRPRSG